MHIVLKIIIVLILLYLSDKYGVLAWMDYPKILVREPISMKSSLNYTKDINFKVGRPEKGINWSMSFWMYIKDLHYREGRKKIIMKTPAFEMYLHENEDKLIIKIPYYKMPCTANRCSGNECGTDKFSNTQDLSGRTNVMSTRKIVNDTFKTYKKKITELRNAKEDFNKETIIVGNSTKETDVTEKVYTEPDVGTENDGVYTCGPESLDGNTLIPSTTETSTGASTTTTEVTTPSLRVGHTICGAAPNEVQYCNHIRGICGADEVSKQISLAVGGIYNSDFGSTSTGSKLSNPGKGIVSYYKAYDKLRRAVEDYKIAKKDYEDAKTNFNNSKSSSVGYSEIEFKDIPLQRWMNVVLLINNRHVDLWINNQLIESRYLPNVPVLSDITFDSISCKDGFNGYISALTVWDHLITRNMIYYLTTNSPVSKSLYDYTIGFYVKSVDGLIDYIEKNLVSITISKPKSKPLPEKITDVDSCK